MSISIFKLILNILGTTLALYLAVLIFPGVTASSTSILILTGVVLGLLNAWLKPLLKILSLPLTILSFGFFTFFINILVLALAVFLVPGFGIATFWSAAGTVVLVSLINTVVRVATFPRSLSPF
ncbi:phage holin family protein [Patescibacteria group bacterium]